MIYGGTLISVSDMERSKNFYEKVMEQTVEMDLGVHVSFQNGLSLQPQEKPDNFQLYFEVEDLDAWEDKLKALEGIEFLHGIKEYPWGQRVMRFYDYDKYIVEVAESMESVAQRFLSQGLSAEVTAVRTMLPVEFVEQFL